VYGVETAFTCVSICHAIGDAGHATGCRVAEIVSPWSDIDSRTLTIPIPSIALTARVIEPIVYSRAPTMIRAAMWWWDGSHIVFFVRGRLCVVIVDLLTAIGLLAVPIVATRRCVAERRVGVGILRGNRSSRRRVVREAGGVEWLPLVGVVLRVMLHCVRWSGYD
jgi:hypothetical protein